MLFRRLLLSLASCLALSGPILAGQNPVDIGVTPNNGQGDVPRTAFTKLNANDTELYAAIAAIKSTLASLALGGGVLTTPKIIITGPGSTGDVSGMSVMPPSFGVISATLASLLDTAQPRVATNAALKTIALPYSRIRRDGFAIAGDGGAMDYTWSGSNCTAADDGAQVQPAGRTGCWLADFSAPSADVRVWGAKGGQDIASALRAAVAWACTTHKPIKLPYAYGSGAQYLLGSQVVIGNGTATTFSTCNNVEFFIETNYSVTSSSSLPPLGMPIRWTGPSDGTVPLVLQGPASNLRLRGVGIDCNALCATGIKYDTITDPKGGDLSVEHNTGPAFVFTSIPNNSFYFSLEGGRFSDLHADFPGSGGSVMQIGNTTCVTNCTFGVLGNIFENITGNYDGSTAGTYGIGLGMASQNTIISPRITPYYVGSSTPGNQGNSYKIMPPPGNLQYPTDNTVVHSLVSGAVDPGPNAAGWAPIAGGINFVGWSTVYQAFPTSTVPGRYTGTDSQGNLFVGKPPQSWTPTDGSGAGLSLTVQDAQWTQIGKVCTITFAVTYPSTASSAVAVLGGLPCAGATGTASRAGGSPSYTDYATPFSVLIGSGTTTANFYAYGGAGLINSQFSGKSIRATLTYITN